MNIAEARKLLEAADVFFGADPDEPPELAQTLNMNDTWGWACADGEYVPDEELPEVARLFWAYGHCGLLYWVSERNDQRRSEFHDINRAIEFVRYEEHIRKTIPNDTKRAYTYRCYVIGEFNNANQS